MKSCSTLFQNDSVPPALPISRPAMKAWAQHRPPQLQTQLHRWRFNLRLEGNPEETPVRRLSSVESGMINQAGIGQP